MTNSTNGRSATSDPTLEQLLDELTDRLAAGEAVDPEGFARRYPEHAEVLLRCLPAMEAMAGLGWSGARSTVRGAPAADGPQTAVDLLGDFRILREVGRGGMGVVYEAEQISLCRRVALKVLPLAAVFDERHLKRFRQEAQAAAQLHHTNIVPVYAVGCERGVHYYAMQFIDGRPLSSVLDGIRDLVGPDSGALTRPDGPGEGLAYHLATGAFATGPMAADPLATASHVAASGPPTSPLDDPGKAPAAEPARPDASGVGSSDGPGYIHSVIRLVVQAAEALEHAHSRGVVHRDIKPSNLLLDGLGNLWVTDFGLARLQNDRGLTMTGDVVGTLRYMSPEQAAGSKDLDHRTDVYSLGVTLYELLALRPAVAGAGQREILRAINVDEPTALRRMNRAVPRDLETIVTKAMAKEPARRYATARALADDLRAFVEHRPISARRPSPLERTAKWVRRHRVVTVSATLVAIATMVTMVFALVAHQRQLDKLAAQVLAQRAEQGRLEARVDALVEEAQRRSSGFAPDFARAVALLTEAIAHRPEDADLYLYRGGARHELHQHADAIADLEHSLLLRPARNPAAHWMIALCALQLGQAEKAKRHREQGEKEAPDSVEALVAQALGLAYDERGLALLDRAIEREPFNPALYAHRGRIAANLVIHRSERRFYDRAVEDLEKALKARPGDPKVLDPLCYCLVNHGHAHVLPGSWPAVSAQAKRHLDEWRAGNPLDPLALWLLADYHIWRSEFGAAVDAAREGQRLAPDNPEISFRLALSLDGLGRHEEAIQAYDRSLELRPTLRTHAWRAMCLGLHLGQMEQARREFSQADRTIPPDTRRVEDWRGYMHARGTLGIVEPAGRNVAEELVRAAPRDPASYWWRAGGQVWSGRDYRGAVDDYTRALELGSLDGTVYMWRARAWAALEQFDKALADLDTVIRGPALEPAAGVRTQDQEMVLTCCLLEKAGILERTGRRDQADRAYREAWASALRALDLGPPAPGWPEEWRYGVVGWFYNSLNALVPMLCRPDEAPHVLEALGDVPLGHANAWMLIPMQWTYFRLAVVLSRTDQPRQEERALRRGLMLWERMARFERLANKPTPILINHEHERALWHHRLADALRRGGRVSEADEHERRSAENARRWREAVDQWVEQQPGNATQEDNWFRQRFVWLLATAPVPAMRDAARARELARRAVERDQKYFRHWNNLGVALYRSGDWDGAVEALGKSRALLGRDDASTGFFLAMAYWRRGDRDEARAHFERAVATASQRGLVELGLDDEVFRFRIEAAALIEPKPPPSHPPEN
jgi:serine/threonine protein kinase/Flp pilus assembly protein TadD